MAHGIDYDGGHDEDHGLTEDGTLIHVPTHQHEVSMDLTEVQLSAEHAFSDRWIGAIRIPFSNRTQDTGIVAPETASQEEIEAMIRNGDIHHRDETFRGIGDPKLLFGVQRSGSLREGDYFTGLVGLSLPFGKTEEDPWIAGAHGEEHTHPQLGNGTVDPLAQLRYGAPVHSRVSLIGGVQARLPLYENSKTYRGPLDMRIDAGAITNLGRSITGVVGYDLLVQGYSYWNGERDQNSGILSHSVRIGFGSSVGPIGLQLSGFFPFYQDLLQAEGDGFEQGPTFLLSLARSL
ncbi:MAG: hypothetical protein KDA27_27420 [Candidatus Eisenbacteria bacterium]|uniref:Uncharacterized protein n=1 Tax=Eiseniibacteriota bacterium TaxID=2212470 RepID=A0A956NJ53_UNCEI|nr:hypothetical protein [Candidatus Eisenbacteria bacterium]